MRTRNRVSERRWKTAAALRSLFFTTGLVTAYFLLPMTHTFSTTTVLTLAIGLTGVTLLLGWHTRAIVASPYPRLRALEALAATVPLFLVIFASAYYVLSRSDPGSLSQPLTRMDALYFTVTVFTTTGFGDITAIDTAARVLTTVQMVSDLLLVGVAARVLVGAVQEGMRRKAAGDVPAGRGGPASEPGGGHPAGPGAASGADAGRRGAAAPPEHSDDP